MLLLLFSSSCENKKADATKQPDTDPVETQPEEEPSEQGSGKISKSSATYFENLLRCLPPQAFSGPVVDSFYYFI